MTPQNTPPRPAADIPDTAMRAIIERILRWHRAAAQEDERTGRQQQAAREHETVCRIESYLAGHQARR